MTGSEPTADRDVAPGYSLGLTVCRLALDQTSGRIRHPGRVGIAIRGALFAELALAGRVTGFRSPRAIGESELTGEPADSLHRAIAERRSHQFKRWFSYTKVDVEAALRALARHELIVATDNGGWRDTEPGLVAEQILKVSDLTQLEALSTEEAVVALLATAAGLAGGRPRPRAALAAAGRLLPPTSALDERQVTTRGAVLGSLRAIRRQGGLRVLSGGVGG